MGGQETVAVPQVITSVVEWQMSVGQTGVFVPGQGYGGTVLDMTSPLQIVLGSGQPIGAPSQGFVPGCGTPQSNGQVAGAQS